MFMKAGMAGPDVGWLREQIEGIQGIDLAAPDPFYFDDGLHQHVLDFQRSNGLTADGIVGKNTIIRLYTQSDRAGVPRLGREPS
jgi:peptidoglycan hydrolase-like protein with peptidoglycan-binding domain